jgi:ribosomal protein S18 acetylase RimI-like enzyme
MPRRVPRTTRPGVPDTDGADGTDGTDGDEGVGLKTPYRIKPGTPSPEVAALVETSMAEYHLAAAVHVPGSTWHADASIVWACTPTELLDMNGVFRSVWHGDAVDEEIAKVRTAVANTRVPYLWHVGPLARPSDLAGRLLAHGFRLHEIEPAMAVDLDRANIHAPWPDRLRVTAVRTGEQMAQWADTWASPAAAAFQTVARGVYGSVPFGERSPFQYRTGFMDGVPVATFLLYLGETAAALHWVATVPAMRRRGVATALAAAGLAEAREAGYHTAVLTASAEARSLYAKLGFREYGDVVRLRAPELAPPGS